MECTVFNETNGKKSELLEELLKVFKGNIDAAQAAYGKARSQTFKDRFGDWEKNYRNRGDANYVAEKMGEVYDNGEPKIKQKKSTGQWYFVDRDGVKDFINKKSFAEFQANEVEEVTKFLLYQYVSNNENRSLNDFEESKLEKDRIMKSIDQSIEAYRQKIKGTDKESLLAGRIDLVEKYKEEFRTELINAISQLGKKFVEVAEEDRGGGVNIKEAFETNAKDNATVNTKIFLSTIESRVIDKETGDFTFVENGFLQTRAFENFNEVWTTLQNLLVDEVGYSNDQNVNDIYDIMRGKLEDMYSTKFWIDDLLDKLDDLPNNKKTEFVQAFTKTKLNFYVTEYNSDTGKYTVINATSTNSRQSQITSQWSTNFQDNFLDGAVLSDSSRDALEVIKKDIDKVYENYNANLKETSKITDAQQKATAQNKVLKDSMKELITQLERIGVRGVEPRDLNTMIQMNGGQTRMLDTIEALFSGVNYMFKNVILKDDPSFGDGDGAIINPFDDQTAVKKLAEAAGTNNTDITDATILANDGKMYYSFTNPTYLSNKINEWKANPALLDQMALDKTRNNSQWLNYLIAKDVDKKDRTRVRQQRLDDIKAGLASSFKSRGKNDGVENTKISFGDQVNDNITKLLGSKLKGNKSYFPTIIAADKSRRIEFEGFQRFDSDINVWNGNLHVGDATIELLTGYFEDEYNRMKKVMRENLELPASKKIVHYHGENGNGLLSQIFPEFSHNGTDPRFAELRAYLYEGKTPKFDDSLLGFDPKQKELLAEAIALSVKDRLQETIAELDKVAGDENWSKSNMNSALVKEYGSKEALAGDYLVNGLISSVEYTKLFSGDPAYYKNTADLIKRIPATYTDGLQLRLEDKDSLIFNQATVQGVEVSSRYVDKILKSVKDKSIADAYKVDEKGKGGVNTTDAQAWITPGRWKFLKKGLGQWGPQHDKVFEKMKTGQKMSPQETKLAAQPLKGVYFEINNGRPVYLKYSQAVLIPSLVKDTPMQALLDKMTKHPDGTERTGVEEIHEVITIDGVKVGAVAPTKINKGTTTELSTEFELNPVILNNRGWKLQQDLPVKTMHETNVGSQIQKNILEGISTDAMYNVDGLDISGADLVARIHATVSELSNMGVQELRNRFGINAEDKITDTEPIYEAIIEEFKTKEGSENIISALEKEMRFDAIPQIRGKVESVFMSIMNKAITKISTEGGSFIQVSPFGLETVTPEGGAVQTVQRYSAKSVAEDQDHIYIFGDNMLRKGKGGQAIIRDNKNAFGIRTKAVPATTEDSYLYDTAIEQNKRMIDEDIAAIKKDGRPVIFPKDGIGTGLAKLKETAPRTYSYLKKRLIEEFGFNNDTGAVRSNKGNGIKIVSNNYNGEALLPPRIENGKVLPGQAMIPHSQIVKILDKAGLDLNKMTMDEAIAMLDPSALELITYRIPNQGMSSNDYLEIVGILPPGVGDSIVVYDGLPAKTGSDFDIDKLFAMQNSLVFNTETNKVEKLTEENVEFYDGDLNENEATIKKKLVQNDLVAAYKAVLNNKATYDNMMRSIDGAFLKDDINGLFKAEPMRNLELFSPIQQLKTKFEYISGKFGVAQTANQLVDHVSNQTLDIRLDHWLGIGNKRMENGKEVTFFDTATNDENSIATNISAFLNAYVDIAKDPYIARGNHNSVTANITFMLLRAGADLKWVNRFMGQPILKELVETIQQADGITSTKLNIWKEVNGKRVKVKASPMEYIKDKYEFPLFGKKADGNTVAQLTKSKLESQINAEERDSIMDLEILRAFEFLQDEAKKFTEGVMAAKSDTAGAGGSNIDRLVNENKIAKVIDDGFIVGYEQKFNNTMLGTYRDNALTWVGDVVKNSNLFLSGQEITQDTYNQISNDAAKGEILVSRDFGKALDNAFYSYMLSSAEIFKDNTRDFKIIMKDTPAVVQKLKNEKSDNFLIQELEIEARSGFQFLGINSKNKPTYYQNKISRAWMDLYDKKDTKALAVDLVKYAYSQSGFQNNLNQFFSFIPHEILRDTNINKDVEAMFDSLTDMPFDTNFVDQFMRHAYEDPKIVSPVNLNFMEAIPGSKGGKVTKSIGFIYSPAATESQELGSLDAQGNRTYPKFVSGKMGQDNHLYQKRGTILRENSNGDLVEVPVYFRTFKLGLKSGKNRVFEYNRNRDGKPVQKSKIFTNNIPEDTGIQGNLAYINLKKQESTFVPDTQAKKTYVDDDANNLKRVDNLLSSSGQVETEFNEDAPAAKIDWKKVLRDKKENGDIKESDC